MDFRAFLLSLALVSFASSALAAPSAAERETARRLMDDGKARTKSGDLMRALEAFEKAHDIMHVPTTGIAVARAHLALGHLVEARDVALEVVRMPRDPGDPAVFEQARKQAKELDAQLKSRIPTVRIVIRGARPAKVTIDDAEVALSLVGEPVAVNPGARVIVAKNESGAEVKTQVTVGERDAKEVDVELPEAKIARDAPSAAPTPGTSPPSTTMPPDSGAGSSERSPVASVMMFGGFGLCAVGLAVGGITGAMALSKASEVKPLCENGICAPAAATGLDQSRSLAMISNIGFSAAAVGAALGIVGLVLPKSSRDSSRASSVLVTPGGIAVRGTF